MKPANLLRIDSLDENWCDKDTIMLHACFQLLSDFFEKERRLDEAPEWRDLAADPQRKELLELYRWWQARKLTDQDFSEESYAEDTKRLSDLVGLRHLLWY